MFIPCVACLCIFICNLLSLGLVELIYALQCFYLSHVVVFPLFITLFS